MYTLHNLLTEKYFPSKDFNNFTFRWFLLSVAQQVWTIVFKTQFKVLTGEPVAYGGHDPEQKQTSRTRSDSPGVCVCVTVVCLCVSSVQCLPLFAVHIISAVQRGGHHLRVGVDRCGHSCLYYCKWCHFLHCSFFSGWSYDAVTRFTKAEWCTVKQLVTIASLWLSHSRHV